VLEPATAIVMKCHMMLGLCWLTDPLSRLEASQGTDPVTESQTNEICMRLGRLQASTQADMYGKNKKFCWQGVPLSFLHELNLAFFAFALQGGNSNRR
jgi:hypothetical protein